MAIAATTGRKVKAQEALELGMVSKVVPLAELDAAVKSITVIIVNDKVWWLSNSPSIAVATKTAMPLVITLSGLKSFM